MGTWKQRSEVSGDHLKSPDRVFTSSTGYENRGLKSPDRIDAPMGVDSDGSQRRIPTSARPDNGERGSLKKDFHMSINLVDYQRPFTFQNISNFLIFLTQISGGIIWVTSCFHFSKHVLSVIRYHKTRPFTFQNMCFQISNFSKHVIWNHVLYWEWEEEAFPAICEKFLWFRFINCRYDEAWHIVATTCQGATAGRHTRRQDRQYHSWPHPHTVTFFRTQYSLSSFWPLCYRSDCGCIEKVVPWHQQVLSRVRVTDHTPASRVSGSWRWRFWARSFPVVPLLAHACAQRWRFWTRNFPVAPPSLTHVHRCIGSRNATRQTLPTSRNWRL